MNRMKYSILFFLSLSLFSCEDVIDLNIAEGETKLVVDGWITDLQQSTVVKLSYSSPYFSNVSNPPASNAVVVLLSSGGIGDTLSETPIGSGLYLTNNYGQVGVTYKIYIKTADNEEYLSLEEEMESVPVIDSIYQEFREETLFDDEGYYVQIDTKEPAGLGDHYRWKFYKNDILFNRSEDLYYADDEFVDGNDIIGFDVHEDALIIGDKARVEQLSISKNAYEFIALVQEQTAFVGSIFDFPASPIQGNVYNINKPNERVLGFFGASSVAAAEIVIQ